MAKTYNVWTDDVSLDRWTDSPVTAKRLGKLAARWLDVPVHVTEYALPPTTDGYWEVDGHSYTRLATYTPTED